MAHAKHRGVNPTRTEKWAEDIAARMGGEWFELATEVDFPAVAAEHAAAHLPGSRETGEQPEADRFCRVHKVWNKAQACFRQAAELAQGGHHGGAVAAGSLVGSVVNGHFRQHVAGQGFLEIEGEQTHGVRIVGLSDGTKRGFHFVPPKGTGKMRYNSVDRGRADDESDAVLRIDPGWGSGHV